MHAVRNGKLCTKDCLCLYVCPTGATDTETGQIDATTCLDGCRACVDACPSHAISLVPDYYPSQQQKTDAVKNALFALAASKSSQEKIAAEIVKTSELPAARKLATALNMSNRIMAEDMLREAGYMLPQSQNTQNLLQELLNSSHPKGFPKETVEKLLELLSQNNIMEDKK